MLSYEHLKETINKNYDKKLDFYTNDKYLGILVSVIQVYPLIKFLKYHKRLQFNQLIDITAVDYPSNSLRFEIIYILLSMVLNKRVVVKTFLGESEGIESITTIHKSADWYERECYDLFGIQFLNHPDLRRIMTDYNFEGHPLRKDFPLTGHTEVRYDDLEKKVIYEPVKLTQEYRNFDYMSPWEGIPNSLEGDDKASEESDE